MRSNDRRKSSENIRNSSCFYGGEVIKHGFLTKSPPGELFSKQSSWKRRYFLLVKLSRNSYTLQYYASQNLKNPQKGEIKLEKVLGVHNTIINPDKLAAVQKMFKCVGDQIICISTKKREYYLIGDEISQVKEWFDAILKAWEETPNAADLAEREEARVQTISLPMPLSRSYPIFGTPRTCEKIDPYTVYHRHSMPEESKRYSEISDSSDEGIYDTPNPILRCIYCSDGAGSAGGPFSNLKCLHDLQKADCDREEPTDLAEREAPDENEGEEENGGGHYVCMRSVAQFVDRRIYCNVDWAGTLSSSQNPPVSFDELNLNAELGTEDSPSDICPVFSPDMDEDITCTAGSATEASPLKQRCSIGRRNCKKRRSTPSLGRFFSFEDASLFTEEDISLPRDGLSTYMELQEVGQRICVSVWSGPQDLGCPFHFGDHILAVNDIGIQIKEDVFKIMTMARSKEVRITVLRVPKSDILHAEGCQCR
ncbi:pleckstrin homology domain-containing family S member 1 isoform X2 [Ambystoma mexicanum]|uniref:pleckstrin homology domain-containing family S member 1 isoform X2 n=1 Tax=Ambystoma mexicanum TaxID=8296 RepID=UPI0037E9152A